MSRSVCICPWCGDDFPEDEMYAPNDWNSHKCPKAPKIVDYEKVLQKHFEEVQKEVEKASASIDDISQKDVYKYRHGFLNGFIGGLNLSLAILDRIERRAKL